MNWTTRHTVLCLASVFLSLVAPLPAHADQVPPTALVEGLVGHPQKRSLSCESRSATDLAAYWGARFTEGAFFRRLPKSDNPQQGFVGDVDMPAGSMPPAGYGVYGGPIAATLRTFGLAAEATRGMNLNRLQQELVAGRPVIIWATYEMQQPGATTWVSSDGVESPVVRWQHTFIAVGYDQNGLSLIDAFDGTSKHYPYDVFKAAWDQLGQTAVTVNGTLARDSDHTWLLAQEADGCRFLVDGRWDVGPK